MTKGRDVPQHLSAPAALLPGNFTIQQSSQLAKHIVLISAPWAGASIRLALPGMSLSTPQTEIGGCVLRCPPWCPQLTASPPTRQPWGGFRRNALTCSPAGCGPPPPGAGGWLCHQVLSPVASQLGIGQQVALAEEGGWQ